MCLKTFYQQEILVSESHIEGDPAITFVSKLYQLSPVGTVDTRLVEMLLLNQVVTNFVYKTPTYPR
uniref:Uncharacterized protein n=1 Tax=Helianthus annuus TaxID=4232 RepID=A0A251T6Z6_HELAN